MFRHWTYGETTMKARTGIGPLSFLQSGERKNGSSRARGHLLSVYHLARKNRSDVHAPNNFLAQEKE